MFFSLKIEGEKKSRRRVIVRMRMLLNSGREPGYGLFIQSKKIKEKMEIGKV